ncbi:hypothetical protein ABPG75_001206 [Micractinium tetrahymenae]
MPSDLPHLCMLEALTAEGATWSDKQIKAELSRERATVLVVDHGAGPVGWAVGWAVPGELHVMNVAVHPDHRRRGHARALLTTLIELHRGAKSALLEVRVSNEPALSLYRAMGFQHVGLRRKYYQDGEDAALMTLQLEPGPAASAE